MRTCLLLPHAFKYKENAALSSSAGERRYFHGICRMFLREAVRDARGRSPVHEGCTLCTHTYTLLPLPPVPFVAPSLLCLFLRAAPRTRSIHISFLFLQVSITRTCLPTSGETRRDQEGGSSCYPRAQTQRNPDTRRANREGKPRQDDIRDSESRLARLKVQKGTISRARWIKIAVDNFDESGCFFFLMRERKTSQEIVWRDQRFSNATFNYFSTTTFDKNHQLYL